MDTVVFVSHASGQQTHKGVRTCVWTEAGQLNGAQLPPVGPDSLRASSEATGEGHVAAGAVVRQPPGVGKEEGQGEGGRTLT